MGASGGLAIVWDDRAITITNIHASNHFIQAKFHLTWTNVHGHLTNVYFRQWATNKVDTLNTLTLINSERSHPLSIIGGDFNMITRLEEKRGGWTKLDCESTHFKNYIHNNMLIDMEFNNGIYTWNNKHVDAHQIASWLDRFLISDNAIHLGGDLLASILPLSSSDHWPIRLHWQRLGDNVRRPFRFEAFWLNHPDFHNLIIETWRNFTPLEGAKMYKLQCRPFDRAQDFELELPRPCNLPSCGPPQASCLASPAAWPPIFPSAPPQSGSSLLLWPVLWLPPF